jgi:hypothetical protein
MSAIDHCWTKFDSADTLNSFHSESHFNTFYTSKLFSQTEVCAIKIKWYTFKIPSKIYPNCNFWFENIQSGNLWTKSTVLPFLSIKSSWLFGARRRTRAYLEKILQTKCSVSTWKRSMMKHDKGYRVARFFLAQYTKTYNEKHTKLPQNFQKTIKYTKRTNILYVGIKYTNISHSKALQNLPKFVF